MVSRALFYKVTKILIGSLSWHSQAESLFYSTRSLGIKAPWFKEKFYRVSFRLRHAHDILNKQNGENNNCHRRGVLIKFKNIPTKIRMDEYFVPSASLLSSSSSASSSSLLLPLSSLSLLSSSSARLNELQKHRFYCFRQL